MPVITVRIKYHLFFPILLRAARQWACIDVMTSALQCTGTTFVLIVLIRRRRTFASWVILIGCAKTDEPITGNITGSFCIFLLGNPAWPSYVVLHDRLAIKYIIWRICYHCETIFRLVCSCDVVFENPPSLTLFAEMTWNKLQNCSSQLHFARCTRSYFSEILD